jgi:two-component system, OmpR family, phosphate regulon sensor histidine kinase PhoR
MNAAIILLAGLCLVLLLIIMQLLNRLRAAKAAALSQEKMIQTLRDELANRDGTNTSLSQETAKLDALILKLRQQMAQSDSDRSNLQKRAESSEASVETLRQQLAKIEKDSQQSKMLFSTMSSVAYDYVIVLDEESKIIALNKSAEELFHDRHPIGEKLHDLVNAPDLEDIVARAINEEDVLEEQFVMDKHNYRARTQVIRYSDYHYFIGIAMQDISHLVKLNRARRDMVANISHELRTPITKIRFTIDSLFHDQNRPKRKASIQSLRNISMEVGALENVVQELLDLSMIESGQAIIKLIDEPLAEIAISGVMRLEERLREKKLTVVRHIPDKLRVLCDRDHIRRVISNLISNALKWSPNNDTITISATHNDEEVTISVFDNGPGVPDDQRERIFERFYQVDTARSGKDGSGLGLALCKHIVEAHGGRIWAEGNSQGGGGRFHFTLLNATPESDQAFIDKGLQDIIMNPASNQTEVSHDEIIFVDDEEMLDS